jgi:hypothetical protein
MEQMSFEDLKKNAAAPVEEIKTEEKKEPVVVATETTDEPEIFIARREFDSGDGSGMEVFEAEGASEKEALDALADKITEGKRNASKKIREQEAELRELRARTAERPQPKEISADDEYVISQEMAKSPIATFRKMFKQQIGFEIEEIAEMKKTADAVKANQQANAAIKTFCATHPDYENDDKAGERNGELMRMKLTELRLPVTSENLSKAYSHLKTSGLLVLKGEKANSEATEETEETERIAQPKVDTAPQRTRKTSTIGTHSRTTAAPVSTDPSEADLYKMPLEELRNRANKQMSNR